jgi:hypothetical protein
MGSAYIGITLMPPLFGRIASLPFMGFRIFPVFIGIVLMIKIITVEVLNKKTGKNMTQTGISNASHHEC